MIAVMGKKYRMLLFYAATIGGFLLLMYLILQLGKPLEEGKYSGSAGISSAPSSVQSIGESFRQNSTGSLAMLLLQIIVILLFTRTFGFLFNRIGQPTVIGEVVAGIFLGPSILGMVFPSFSSFLFPQDSLAPLQFFSQVGLILFMFVIGMEVPLKQVRNTAKEAIVISHASIIIPYALGMGLSLFLYKDFAPGTISFLTFSLFIGIAMSITAFPVLARILRERGMTQTPVGVIAITCAAIDDLTAWCILAVVISIAKAASLSSALLTITLVVGYLIVMMQIVKPMLERMARNNASAENLSLDIVAAMFGVLLVSSYVTEVIGIHALFGAFIAGVVMPPSMSFRKLLSGKVEYISLALLLPVFFAFSGLRTRIGLLDSAHEWEITIFIIIIAIAGKFGGSMLAARFAGQSWQHSFILGALINTRGLMELVVLNIGYETGVLTAEIFSMMVLMALVTTFMTGPALDLANRLWKKNDVMVQTITRQE
jgi:Kef-type K+ transport system membrane component KefB